MFGRCFKSWVASLWPGRHDFIAIDGKTARRTHDHRKGLKALHTLSAYATTARLVLAQTCVPEKTNEITAIPDLLDELAETGQLEGALVTIDAMGCQVEIADKIVAHKADYLLALKGNQPTLETDVEDYFRTAPAGDPRNAHRLDYKEQLLASLISVALSGRISRNGGPATSASTAIRPSRQSSITSACWLSARRRTLSRARC